MVGDQAAQIERAERRADDAEAKAWAEADGIYREALGEMVRQGRVGFELPVSRPEIEPENPEAGAKVRELRALVGWNQRDLASALNIDQSTVARMERSGRSERLDDAIALLEKTVREQAAAEAEEMPA